MKIMRRKSRIIKIGNLAIGGRNPIAIQSMAKTKTSNIERAARQIKELEDVGCQIVRLAVKDASDAKALKAIKAKVIIPIVADIHFDWRLAQEAIENGADKVRLNPGNIYRKEQVSQIAKAAKAAGIPIRIGLNSGSLPEPRTQNPKPRNIAGRMVKSALDYIKILEKSGFYNIVISLKASNIFDTIDAYRSIAAQCDYPLHLGVTATGSAYSGLIKSSIALSILLLEGIGDTIRVSLTDEPKEEVKAAKFILEAIGLGNFGPQIISCPTCGRCDVDLVKIVNELEKSFASYPVRQLSGLTGKPIKVAVMGCVVNGPGEASEADIGVAFGKKEGLLFKKGKPVKKISPDKCVDVLLKEILRSQKN